MAPILKTAIEKPFTSLLPLQLRTGVIYQREKSDFILIERIPDTQDYNFYIFDKNGNPTDIVTVKEHENDKVLAEKLAPRIGNPVKKQRWFGKVEQDKGKGPHENLSQELLMFIRSGRDTSALPPATQQPVANTNPVATNHKESATASNSSPSATAPAKPKPATEHKPALSNIVFPEKTKTEVAFEDLKTGVLYPVKSSSRYLFIEKTENGFDFCFYENDANKSFRNFSISQDANTREDKKQIESLSRMLNEKTLLKPRKILAVPEKNAKREKLSDEFLSAYLHGVTASKEDTSISALESRETTSDPQFAQRVENLNNRLERNEGKGERTPSSIMALGAAGAGLALAGTALQKSTDEPREQGEEKSPRFGFLGFATVALGATLLVTAFLAAKKGKGADNFLDKIKAGWSFNNSGGRGV